MSVQYSERSIQLEQESFLFYQQVKPRAENPRINISLAVMNFTLNAAGGFQIECKWGGGIYLWVKCVRLCASAWVRGIFDSHQCQTGFLYCALSFLKFLLGAHVMCCHISLECRKTVPSECGCWLELACFLVSSLLLSTIQLNLCSDFDLMLLTEERNKNMLWKCQYLNV